VLKCVVVLNLTAKKFTILKRGSDVIKKVAGLTGEKAVGVLIRGGSKVTLLSNDEEVENLTKTMQWVSENVEH
jgi:hypothetical protein